MKLFFLLSVMIMQFENSKVETIDCLSYYDESNKLTNSQRCISNITSCCGLCNLRFCCSILSPFLPILDQNKCENNYSKRNSTFLLNSNKNSPPYEELDGLLDPFTNYGITIAVFIGLTFLISIIFICLACCIICQRKRAQEQNRCMQRRSLNNNVYFNSNNQFVSILERNQQIAEVAGDNNINTIYKPYGAYSYEDLNPPAYSTLKFN